MTTSITLDRSHRLGLICCHKAHQHHVTPKISLIMFTQQTRQSDTSICPKWAETEHLAGFAIVELLCFGGPGFTRLLVAPVRCCIGVTIQTFKVNGVVLAQDAGTPNLFPSVIYLPHLEKGNRLWEAVGSKMIWSSILLNWLLPA